MENDEKPNQLTEVKKRVIEKCEEIKEEKGGGQRISQALTSVKQDEDVQHSLIEQKLCVGVKWTEEERTSGTGQVNPDCTYYTHFL